MGDDVIDRVWIPASEAGYPYEWRVGEVVEFLSSEQQVKVEIRGDNDEADPNASNHEESRILHVPLHKTRPYIEQHAQDWPDLLQMGDLHDASLLELFHRRYMCGKIYSNAGPVMISINPYEYVDSTTVQDTLDMGVPHIYNVAVQASENLVSGGPKGRSQSILVNGESGAGKTEACKNIVKYLAFQSGRTKSEEKTETGAQIDGLFKHMGIRATPNANPVFAAGKRGGGALTKRLRVDTAAPTPTDKLDNVEKLIIDTTPLLESFGNAQTIRNNNSSRFGKFIQLFYDHKNGPIVGANTMHFLLEKSRIVGHAKGERNYHVFYQVLAAAQQGEFQNADLRCDAPQLLIHPNASEYRILTPQQPATEESTGHRDSDDYSDMDDTASQSSNNACLHEDVAAFRETCAAMEAVGIAPAQQIEVWKVLAAILCLGNVQFKKSSKSGHRNMDSCRVSKKTKKYVVHAASLLQVDAKMLEQKLCSKEFSVGRGTQSSSSSSSSSPDAGGTELNKQDAATTIPLSKAQARESLDGLVKAVYTQLFDWLIFNVNKSSGFQKASSPTSSKKQKLFIGILDIFGFEILETNSFEQLCINFANEVLQQMFDERIFTWEKQEYEQENVDHSMLTYQDNSKLLSIFTNERSGIFPLLNQQCMVGVRDDGDALFLSKLQQHHLQRASRKLFSVPKLRRDSAFVIHHYVSDVEYSVQDFTSKNVDSVQHGLIEFLAPPPTGEAASAEERPAARQFLQDVFGVKVVQGLNQSAASSRDQRASSSKGRKRDSLSSSKSRRRKMAQLCTVSTRFNSQIAKLKKVLHSTSLNFVRCVKPNNDKQPKVWDAELVMKQLVFLGVMNLIRIRNEGFPVRRAFSDVISRYPEVAREAGIKWIQGGNDEAACRNLLTFAFANTKLMDGWKVGSSKCFLKSSVLEKLDHIVREKRNKGAARLQYLARRRKARHQLKMKREASIVLTKHVRRYLRRREFLKLRHAVDRLKATRRGKMIRRRYVEIRQAAIVIQRFANRFLLYLAMEEFVKVQSEWTSLSAVVKIQSFARMTLVHLQVERAKYYFARLQCVYRSYIIRKRYKEIKDNREPWKAFLRPNESVVHTSLVVKTTETKSKSFFTIVSKKKRQLIMTSGPRPRIFYIDPVTKKLKGEIVWHETKTTCMSVSETDFLIQSTPSLEKGKSLWHFSDLEAEPALWVRAIREPTTVLDKIHGHGFQEMNETTHDKASVFKDGYVMRLEYGSRKLWQRLWLRVQGIEIQFFESEDHLVPCGCITIDSRISVEPTEEGDNRHRGDDDLGRSFQLFAPMYEKGLMVRCLTPEDRDDWVEMINLVLESEKFKDEKPAKVVSGVEKFSKFNSLITQKDVEIEKLKEELTKVKKTRKTRKRASSRKDRRRVNTTG